MCEPPFHLLLQQIGYGLYYPPCAAVLPSLQMVMLCAISTLRCWHGSYMHVELTGGSGGLPIPHSQKRDGSAPAACLTVVRRFPRMNAFKTLNLLKQLSTFQYQREKLFNSTNIGEYAGLVAVNQVG